MMNPTLKAEALALLSQLLDEAPRFGSITLEVVLHDGKGRFEAHKRESIQGGQK